MDKKEKKSLPEPRTYTVEQIAAMLNIGRTTAYQLVKQEEFRIVRIPQLMKHYGVTEQLKAADQLEWVRQMNACVAQAEEVIKDELIYS